MELSVFHTILITGIASTTTMTLFSQIVSKVMNREFNEARLLNKFIDRTKCLPDVSGENAFWGWVIHYLIGVIMTAWMYYVFKNLNWETTILTGVILGLFAGLIGAVGWLGLFILHPKPPKTQVNEFLIQLLMAHCIFGCTVALILGTFF